MPDGNESNWWPGRPESNGYADPRTSGSRSGQPPWEQPVPPSWDQPVQPHWEQSPVQPAREQPVAPSWEQQPARQPWDQPMQRPQEQRPQDQGQRARNPRQDPDEWGWMSEGGPDGRPRQLPREAPGQAPYPAAPGGRHRSGPPGADLGRERPEERRAESGAERPEERRGLGRTVTFVGGGLIVAVVLVTFGLGFSRGGGSGIPATAPTEAAKPNPSLTAQSGPGTPTVTARALSGQQVEFSWSYANPASGDTFRVTNNGGQPTTVNKPDLVLSVTQGQKACIQVQVVTASGTASAQSGKVCYPS